MVIFEDKSISDTGDTSGHVTKNQRTAGFMLDLLITRSTRWRMLPPRKEPMVKTQWEMQSLFG